MAALTVSAMGANLSPARATAGMQRAKTKMKTDRMVNIAVAMETPQARGLAFGLGGYWGWVRAIRRSRISGGTNGSRLPPIVAICRSSVPLTCESCWWAIRKIVSISGSIIEFIIDMV